MCVYVVDVQMFDVATPFAWLLLQLICCCVVACVQARVLTAWPHNPGEGWSFYVRIPSWTAKNTGSSEVTFFNVQVRLVACVNTATAGS